MKQSQLKNIFLDQNKDLIWMVDTDFKLVYANQAYFSMIKVLTGEEVKLNDAVFVEGFGKDHIEKWKIYYKRAIDGEFFEFEDHNYHPKTKEIQYGLVSFKPVVGDNQEVVAVACQSRDITEMIKEKNEVNRMINSSLDVFCAIDEEGKFVQVSAASKKLWGYTPEELVGTRYVDLILEEDVPKTNEIAADILSGKEIKTFTNRYKKKDGDIAYNLWSARWDDSTKLMHCVARDGREHIEKEKLILQSEQRFKALVQEGSDLIAIINIEGVYQYVSPTSEKVLGIPPDYFLGKNAFEFIHPEDAERVLMSLQKIPIENKIMIEPFRFQNHKKEWRWVETVLTNMLENPVVNGVVANSKDITDEKKLYELFRQTRQLAKIGSWEVDLVNQSLYWSDEVHQMHGTDPNTFVPSLEEGINFYREDFRELVSQSVKKCISSGEPYDFEAVIVTAKNKELWVRSIGNAGIVNGECKRIYGSFQDINDRKEVELRLQSLADNLPGVVFQYYIHPDGIDRLLSVSQGSKEVWGFTAEEVMQNNQLVWNQILLGGDIENVQKSISDSVASKSKWSARWKYVMSNGELKTHLGYGSPSYLADGTVVFNSVILDITTDAKNEELLEQVSNLAKIGGWELNLNTMTPYFSEQTFKIYDLPLGTPPKVEDGINFYAKEAQPIIKKAVDEAIEYHTPFHLELPFITAKGNEIWVRTSGNVEVLDGKAIRLYGAIQDITSKKESEQEKNSLQETLENSLNEIYTFDAESLKLTYVNKGALLNLGYSEHEIKTLTAYDIKPEFTAKSFRKLLTPLLNNEKDKIIFFTNHQRKDGSVYPIEAHLQLITVGKTKKFLGIVLDITARKKAEQEIRFKANLLSMVRQAVIATNLDGEVSYWNKEAEIMYGWKQQEALGMNIMQLTPIETNKEEAKQIMGMLKKGQSWSGEFEVQKKDGTNFITMITNSPIYDENNKLKGIIGISSDITQEIKNKELLKQYTKELERSNEELEQFAFVASHDLQEPLRMISSFMNLLDKKYGDKLDEKAKQYIHFATEGAKSMKRIILDLLEYSRARVSTEGKEEVDMNEVLAEFKHLRRKFISEKKAIIKSNNLPTLYTYKVAVTQVLHCLVDNAIKYSKEDVPPIVEINAIENEKEWKFSIKDNGIGIDTQFYDKIFIIFQRLHNKDQFSGTGIGLSVAKRHIEFLGGQIWLESVPGEGTVFYFTISKST